MGITVCDVGPRDGLQNEAVVLAPAARAELCNRLAAAGVPRIEAVSFVRDDRVPAMAGAEEVVKGLERREGVVYAGLVLNETGYERLAATGLDEAHVTFAATETFSRRNANASLEEAVAAAEAILARAREDGIRATATISVAFGCPYEGVVPAERVLELADRVVTAGAAEVVFADTIGVAVPGHVEGMVANALGLGVPVGVHLHNTRNTAIACAYAALRAGATVFDASVGGAGGCPFAPNATGNVATEDLVYLLHGEGVETGIDLDTLTEVARWLEGQLGHGLDGLVHRAGTFPSPEKPS
ncbi:MAG TPA: hydroxymethylglutaryl-CoA lyase [Gaiellaceae bacterium]|nr:hydroxymethylglutaryl-CoA lyase [Gaiellaceae bacterium]